jgi:tetratricopeptide (TPR) repeat protein
MKYLHYVIIFSFIFNLSLSAEEKKGNETKSKDEIIIKEEKPKEIEKITSSAVIANIKKDGTLYLQINQEGTQVILDIDTDPNDIFFDINISKPKKEVKEEIKKEEKKESDIEKKIAELMQKIEKSRNELTQPEINTSEVLKNIYEAQKLYYTNNYKEALTYVQKSLQLKETALGYALEGTIFLSLGNRKLAIESWKKALSLDPNMEEVRTILKLYGE